MGMDPELYVEPKIPPIAIQSSFGMLEKQSEDSNQLLLIKIYSSFSNLAIATACS